MLQESQLSDDAVVSGKDALASELVDSRTHCAESR